MSDIYLKVVWRVYAFFGYKVFRNTICRIIWQWKNNMIFICYRRKCLLLLKFFTVRGCAFNVLRVYFAVEWFYFYEMKFFHSDFHNKDNDLCEFARIRCENGNEYLCKTWFIDSHTGKLECFTKCFCQLHIFVYNLISFLRVHHYILYWRCVLSRHCNCNAIYTNIYNVTRVSNKQRMRRAYSMLKFCPRIWFWTLFCISSDISSESSVIGSWLVLR